MVTQTHKRPKADTLPYYARRSQATRIVVSPEGLCEQWCKLMALFQRRVGRMCPAFDMADVHSRPIICTSSDTHYGDTGHWVISVEGTPPRGTILFDTNEYVSPAAVLMCQSAVCRLTGRDYKIVKAFVAAYLAPAK